MNEFLLIGGMALVTLLVRYPVLAVSGRLQFSPRFLKILGFVPPAVLTAIVFPAVLMPTGNELALTYMNARLVGAIVTVAVGFWKQNLLLTIGVGMLAFFAWQWLLMVLA